jgi:hypothetical protein
MTSVNRLKTFNNPVAESVYGFRHVGKANAYRKNITVSHVGGHAVPSAF